MEARKEGQKEERKSKEKHVKSLKTEFKTLCVLARTGENDGKSNYRLVVTWKECRPRFTRITKQQ
jgi:hypothetical protein